MPVSLPTTTLTDASTSLPIVAAVLLAALLHATWNAIAHGIGDRLAGFALIGIAYTVVSAPVTLAVDVPTAQAWPLIVASAAVHALYQLALLTSYRLGEFSQVYPFARGTSPLVVIAVTTGLLGQALAPAELIGAVVVSLGLLGFALVGGIPTRQDMPALASALLTGLLIATYTIIDGFGVRSTDMLGYAAWLFLLQGPVMPVVGFVVRGRQFGPQLRPFVRTGLTGGAVSLAAYGIVLWAQTAGALGPIAALRETSIVFGAVIGAAVFGERLGTARAVAAVVVVAGIVLINTG